MPSSKLREVTSGSVISHGRVTNSRHTVDDVDALPGKRSSRLKEVKKYVDYGESEDEEDEDEEEELEEEEEEEEEEEDEEMNDADEGNGEVEATDEEEDEEEEEEDEDEEMEETPAPPAVKQTNARAAPKVPPKETPKMNPRQLAKPSLIVTPAVEERSRSVGNMKSVIDEDDEDDDEDDEELSELDSDAEDEDQDETNAVEEDAEGDEDELGGEGEEDEEEEEELEGDDEEMDGDEDIDSDETPGGSGTSTPRLQTKRQRAEDEGGFLALPMEPQIKKVLTADEHRMRRAEMARRRKNLSEKRNAEEKVRKQWAPVLRLCKVF